MEMVHQAIYSLPQYGLSDLLSPRQGNNNCFLFLFVSFYYFEPVDMLYISLDSHTLSIFLQTNTDTSLL